MTGRAFSNSPTERSANLLVSSDGHLRVADDGPGLSGKQGKAGAIANGSNASSSATLTLRTITTSAEAPSERSRCVSNPDISSLGAVATPQAPG